VDATLCAIVRADVRADEQAADHVPNLQTVSLVSLLIGHTKLQLLVYNSSAYTLHAVVDLFVSSALSF
jgi:hypothetical protein